MSAPRYISRILLTHRYALSQLSELSSLVIQSPRSPRYLPALTVNRFLNHSLFSRCGNSSSTRVSQPSATQDIHHEKGLQSQPIAMASPSTMSSSWDGGKAMPSMFTSMNVKNLIIFRKFSFSTRNSSLLLFTNLSGIIDGLAKLSSYLRSPHTTVVWPVETCREISLIQKLRRFTKNAFLTYDHESFTVHWQTLNWSPVSPLLRPLLLRYFGRMCDLLGLRIVNWRWTS